MTSRKTVFALLLILAALGGLFWHSRSDIRQTYGILTSNSFLPDSSTGSVKVEAAAEPEPTPVTKPEATPSTDTPPVKPAPVKPINHQVPFAVQAPDANWTPFYEEMCEEASLILARRWEQNDTRAILPAAEFDLEINKLAAWERDNLGTDVSTTIAQGQKTLTDFYQIPADQVKLATVTTPDDLKKLLQTGIIVAPFSGRDLKNPNYKNGGPRYHMLVITGFTDQKFITNDVGTKRGAGYQYSPDLLLSALHDFVPEPEEIKTGQKQVLQITRP